jgi:DNA-binding PadR family transcriptional regulator
MAFLRRKDMTRGKCKRHINIPCSCAMGNLYRYTEPVALYLLKTQGQTHGYDLANLIQKHALTDSVIESGALYRTLRRLELNGFVTSTWDIQTAGPARRIYSLTPAGEAHLSDWSYVLGQLCDSIHRFRNEVDLSLNPATSKTAPKQTRAVRH